jgi:hypothetical protein
MADMLVDAFQYPEHPEWSIQSDEQRQIVESLRRMRRIWPLVRVLQGISPSLRDILRGFVFEENGAIGGTNGDTTLISTEQRRLRNPLPSCTGPTGTQLSFRVSSAGLGIPFPVTLPRS